MDEKEKEAGVKKNNKTIDPKDFGIKDNGEIKPKDLEIRDDGKIESKALKLFKRSLYTDQCLELILETGKGTKINKGIFEERTGLDEARAKSHIYSARRIALNQYGLVTRCKNGEIEILTDNEIASRTKTEYFERHLNSTRKTLKELKAIENFDGMTNQAKLDHNIAVSMLSVFEQMTKPIEIDKLEERFSKKPLGFRQTLELFVGKKDTADELPGE